MLRLIPVITFALLITFVQADDTTPLIWSMVSKEDVEQWKTSGSESSDKGLKLKANDDELWMQLDKKINTEKYDLLQIKLKSGQKALRVLRVQWDTGKGFSSRQQIQQTYSGTDFEVIRISLKSKEWRGYVKGLKIFPSQWKEDIYINQIKLLKNRNKTKPVKKKATSIKWKNSRSAKRILQNTEQPILMVVTDIKDNASKEIWSKVFKDQEVIDLAQDFVCVSLLPSDKRFYKNYIGQVTKVPCFVFLARNEKKELVEMERIYGLVTDKQFAKFMKLIKKRVDFNIIEK